MAMFNAKNNFDTIDISKYIAKTICKYHAISYFIKSVFWLIEKKFPSLVKERFKVMG